MCCPLGSKGPLWNSLRLTVSSCSMLKTQGRYPVRLLGLMLLCLKSLVGLFKEQPGQAVSVNFCDWGVRALSDVSRDLTQCCMVTWYLELTKSRPKMGELLLSSHVAHQYEQSRDLGGGLVIGSGVSSSEGAVRASKL